MFRCAMGLALVTAAGILTWYISRQVSRGSHPKGNLLVSLMRTHKGGNDEHPIEWKWDAQISGWASAFLYRELVVGWEREIVPV